MIQTGRTRKVPLMRAEHFGKSILLIGIHAGLFLQKGADAFVERSRPCQVYIIEIGAYLLRCISAKRRLPVGKREIRQRLLSIGTVEQDITATIVIRVTPADFD